MSTRRQLAQVNRENERLNRDLEEINIVKQVLVILYFGMVYKCCKQIQWITNELVLCHIQILAPEIVFYGTCLISNIANMSMIHDPFLFIFLSSIAIFLLTVLCVYQAL